MLKEILKVESKIVIFFYHTTWWDHKYNKLCSTHGLRIVQLFISWSAVNKNYCRWSILEVEWLLWNKLIKLETVCWPWSDSI